MLQIALCFILIQTQPTKILFKANSSSQNKKRGIDTSYGAQLVFGDNNTVSNPTLINSVSYWFTDDLICKLKYFLV